MLAQSFSSDNSSQGNTYKGLPYWQSPCCMFLLHDWEQQHHIPLKKKNTQRMLAGSDHFSFTLILFVIRFHIRPLFIFWIFWVKSTKEGRDLAIHLVSKCLQHQGSPRSPRAAGQGPRRNICTFMILQRGHFCGGDRNLAFRWFSPQLLMPYFRQRPVSFGQAKHVRAATWNSLKLICTPRLVLCISPLKSSVPG